jgi:hypothetical protein
MAALPRPRISSASGDDLFEYDSKHYTRFGSNIEELNQKVCWILRKDLPRIDK